MVIIIMVMIMMLATATAMRCDAMRYDAMRAIRGGRRDATRRDERGGRGDGEEISR
jgi:hypothetical protein